MRKSNVNLYDSASIRKAMTDQRVTIEELAAGIGFSTPTVWKLRTGQNVQVATLAAACQYLRLQMIIGRNKIHNGRSAKKS